MMPQRSGKKCSKQFLCKIQLAQYGNILDNFIVVESKLVEIKKLNIKMPNQVMVLAIISNNF